MPGAVVVYCSLNSASAMALLSALAEVQHLGESEQRPEQHGRCFCIGQHGLGLDPALERD